MRSRIASQLGRTALVLGLITAASSAARAQLDSVKTMEVDAPSVGLKMKYNVALPEDYETSGKRYPVLYLLHGLTSDYVAWAKLGAPGKARHYDLILVMPDVGNTWYVDWKAAEGDRPNNWETFLTKDLIGHVDANFRTVASRAGRAISGLSMGGYGALTLGLRNPDLFCSIGSQSGALGIARLAAQRIKDDRPPARPSASKEPNPEIGIEGFSSQDERTPKGRAFATVDDCEAHDPFLLVRKVPAERRPHIYLDCGTEDGLLGSNVEFARLLLEERIPFTYAQSQGGHRPPYWVREIGQVIAVQHEILQRNLTAAGAVVAP